MIPWPSDCAGCDVRRDNAGPWCGHEKVGFEVVMNKRIETYLHKGRLPRPHWCPGYVEAAREARKQGEAT